ncbi:MAG: 3-hydroxybutyryl-CoA dehydrogenase [Clostridiales bacterium]|nr:3-hydroxybutyryl-CoA dehydrogenase [Clostridiales bacterium]
MTIKKVGIVGAGMMGAEIGLCFALKGYEVIMVDREMASAVLGKEKQANAIDKRIKKGKLDEADKHSVLARVTPADDYGMLSDCDMIVEAVYESYELKTEIYKKLDRVCKNECIIASNTSSISITKLASVLPRERAEKFIGAHFFSPASIMKLVEIIPGILTDAATIASTQEILEIIDKVTITCKDVTGFVVNRLFHVYAVEACRLLEEGVCSVEDIDIACTLGLGYPIGPFKLLDNMGHDLNISVDEVLFQAYGERFRPSSYMRRLVDANLLGRKTGEGFYKY